MCITMYVYITPFVYKGGASQLPHRLRVHGAVGLRVVLDTFFNERLWRVRGDYIYLFI